MNEWFRACGGCERVIYAPYTITTEAKDEAFCSRFCHEMWQRVRGNEEQKNASSLDQTLTGKTE